MYLVLTLVAIVAAFVAMRYLLRRAPISIRQYVIISAVTAVALVLVVLGLTGRIPWIAAVAGAILPFLGRLLGFLRILPLIRLMTGRPAWGGPFGAWGSPFRARGSPFRARAAASAGNQSRVQTRFIAMELDHDSGHMDGEVQEGYFTGKRLSDLTLAQLLELRGACVADADSLRVLEAYLDRHHENWREQAGAGHEDEPREAMDRGTMNERHALEILGLAGDASREEIVAAHRKLMQKLHPDRGGSTYLAAKINEAKDFLLHEASRKDDRRHRA